MYACVYHAGKMIHLIRFASFHQRVLIILQNNQCINSYMEIHEPDFGRHIQKGISIFLLNFQFSFGTCASNDLYNQDKSENAQEVERKSTAIAVYQAV